MKRILSLVLCMAMLLSLIPMVVTADSAIDADPEKLASITTENVVRYTPDKETYKPGEIVYINVSMDSIWGDPELVGHIPGYEDEMPGAYGMSVLTACVVFGCFDSTNYSNPFTPMAVTDLASSSTILNMDRATVGKSALSDAKRNGWMNWFAGSPSFTEEEDAYGMFNGSGDLCTFRLKVNEDATPGTYYIPVGPYAAIVTEKDDAIAFGDIHMNYFGVCNSFNDSVDPNFVTAVTNTDYKDPKHADNPYEGSYVKVVIEGDYTEDDKAAAANVDTLINNIGDVKYNAGNADGILIEAGVDAGAYLHVAPVTGNKFTFDFDMIPVSGGDEYSYLGGCTAANGENPKLFWNNAAKRFMIARTNNWMNSNSVTEVLAQSDVMDLPTDALTHVQYVYNGSNLSIKVDGVTVCSWYGAIEYNFYIFYPSQVTAYMSNLVFAGESFETVSYKNFEQWNAAVSGSWNGDSAAVMDSDALITAAEDAYAALTPAQKTLVTDAATLTAAREKYESLAANRAINAIAKIGEVIYNPYDAASDSGEKIAAAEAIFNALSKERQALVTNAADLTAARATYDAAVVNFDKAKAGEVDALIDAIGNVTFESREAIEAAEEAYAALTDAQKALVTKYDVLVAARADYDKYLPVMEVENLIDAIGPIKYQGTVTHFDFVDRTDKGYYNFPDKDGDNCWWGFSITYDFMYTAYTDNGKAANIGFIRNGESFAGYDFKTKSFAIGSGAGFYNNYNGVCDFVAQKPYDLVAGKWYTMTVEYVEGSALARVYLNGELMVEGNTSNPSYNFAMFYPQNVDLYLGENTLTFGATYPYPFTTTPFTGRVGDLGTYTPNVLIDVESPASTGDRITAAEDAFNALTEEQQALVSEEYKTILTDARTAFDAKYAELKAAADATIEIIDAMVAGTATVDEANASFNALYPTSKTLVTNLDQLQKVNTDAVIALIDAIGDVTLSSGDAITAAEKAYNALTAEEKALVTNADTLTAARAEFNANNTAVNNAITAINKLQTFLKFNAVENGGDGNGYSQFLDKAETMQGGNTVAPYTVSFDINTVAADTDWANSYFGGCTSNGIFLGYDFKGQRFVIANENPFGGNTAKFADENIYASADYTIDFGEWYSIEFVLGANYAEIFVDGVSVAKADNLTAAGWFIYYPRACTSYYDNYKFSYNGVVEDTVASFTDVGTDTWVALNGDGYSLAAAELGRFNLEFLADAVAAYDAVPAKVRYGVSNYDVLVAASKAAAVIENIETVAGEESITVSWDAVDNAYRYWVFLDDECVAGIDPADETSVTVKASAGAHKITVALEVYLPDGTRYYVGQSEPVQATANAANIPAVNNIVTVAGEESITVSWDAVDNAYRYWIFLDGTCVKGIDPSEGTSATIKATAGDHQITVALEVYRDNGTRWYIGQSAPVAATANARVIPSIKNLVVTSGDGELTVEWDAVENAYRYWIFLDDVCVKGLDPVNDGAGATVKASAGEHTVTVALEVYRADGTRWYIGKSATTTATAN